MYQTSQREDREITSQRKDREITAARRQAGGHVMMTTNKQPLIMTWSKTAPKGTKRALSHHNDDDEIS